MLSVQSNTKDYIRTVDETAVRMLTCCNEVAGMTVTCCLCGGDEIAGGTLNCSDEVVSRILNCDRSHPPCHPRKSYQGEKHKSSDHK